MIRLFNTKHKQKEEFKSLKKGEVKIYSCGPTVYSYQHIGNMRAALCWDFLKRTFRFFKYDVIDVTNITDVGHLVSDGDAGEDKMLKAAIKEKKDPFEIARFYERVYLDDLESLNVIPSKFFPRATETVDEQIEVIRKLEEKGFTYVTDDGVYFDVSKFEGYGSLSGQSLDEKKVGARVIEDSSKRNPQDFALWKFLTLENKNHVMKWNSPWGEGFPGWHIECSAMSAKFLGKEFDIHTGGIEHIPVHHENEIAQNTCSGVVSRINYWMHNNHLLVNNEKMSKSLGNVYRVADLVERGYCPFALRELNLRTHYRKQVNFTFESLDCGETNVKKINEFYAKIKQLKVSRNDVNEEVKKIYLEKMEEFENALSDDINTPLALSQVYEFMSEINKIFKFSKEDIILIKKFMMKTNEVIGLIKDEEEVSIEVFELAKKRKKARDGRNWEEADRLRDEIKTLGYDIKDDNDAKVGFILKEI